jgi:hypothetical protein
VSLPAGPQATITTSAVLNTDATWSGVPGPDFHYVNVSRHPRKVAARPARSLSRHVLAPRRAADRPGGAARPPRGAPPPGSCSDSGGPGPCAAKAGDGVRPLGGRETSEERRQQPSCTSERTDSRGIYPTGACSARRVRCRGAEAGPRVVPRTLLALRQRRPAGQESKEAARAAQVAATTVAGA